MHLSSERWFHGLILALLTAILWGILPITMKEVLKGMDPYTVTWYRFSVAGLVLLIYLYSKKRLPHFKGIPKKFLLLTLFAILGLLGNYILYVIGLRLSDPSTAQLMMQIGQIILIITSVIIFKENFNFIQLIALIILLFGFLLFFNQHIIELLTSVNNYSLGIIILLISSISWVIYALCQKQLLAQWNSMQILLMVYLGSSFLLFPSAHPHQITNLTSVQFWLLVFSCLNTIIAYGAFAEALAYWEASKVTAILAIAPLITLMGVCIGSLIWPAYVVSQSLNVLAYIGAIIVVIGSALVALSPIIIKEIKVLNKLHKNDQ